MSEYPITSGKGKFVKLYKRLDKAVESKEFYEAHQLYRTLYNRLNLIDEIETISILNQGTQFLLENSESESGSELALLLVKYYSQKSSILTEEQVLKLKNYFALMKNRSVERKSFIQICQKLLLDKEKFRQLFNNWIAVILWKENQFCEARYHFIMSGNGIHTGLFLIQYSRLHGYDEVERDLFVVQAVLQFLCLGKIDSASLTFFIYIRNHPVLKECGLPPFKQYALLNFIWLLLHAIKYAYSAEVFNLLCKAYKVHLTRDACYHDYLTRIGSRYFNIQPPTTTNRPANSANGFLDNFLGLMMSEDANMSDMSMGAGIEFVSADEMD